MQKTYLSRYKKHLLSWIFIAIILIPVFIALACLEAMPYNSLLKFIVVKLNRPDLYNLLKDSLFTEERYSLIYKIHWIIYPLLIFLLITYFRYRKIIINFLINELYNIFLFIKAKFYEIRNWRKNILFIILIVLYFVLSFYKILNRGITYDEAWNYNYFISKPPYFSFILFNTYPLYHFIASFINFIPFDPCIIGRLLSVFCGFILIVLLYVFENKIFNNKVALIMILFLFASPLFIIYSAIIKGVILSIALSFVHFYSCFLYTQTKTSRSTLFIYLSSSFLLIISMPTALIFCMATCSYLLYKLIRTKQMKNALKVLFYFSITLMLSMLFYLPILISSGKDKIIGSENNGQFLHLIQSYFYSTSVLCWGNKYLNLIIIVVGFIFLFFQKNYKNNKLIKYSLFIILFTGIFFLKKSMPDRSLAFLFIPYLIIISCIVSQFISYLELRKPILSYCVYIILLITLFFPVKSATYQFANPHMVDKTLSKRISNFLLVNHVKTCYVQQPDFWINYPEIEYYYTLQKQFWNMHNGQDNSTRYLPFNITDNYDCIITDTSCNLHISPLYKMVWQENAFRIFLKTNK